jgi:hypothetical protein
LGGGGVHDGEKACNLGRWRAGEKDTVFLRQRSVGNLPVVGAEQPRGVVEGELGGPSPASLTEIRSEPLVGPEPMQLPCHLGDVIRVEQQSRVADDFGEPGRGG